jgi:broad specificity phosphatase PhoE
MRLIFLRHAESEANIAGDNSDHPETKLSKLGELQAKKAAEYITYLNKIKSLNIKYILSSPFTRTVDTAKPIAAKLSNLFKKKFEVNIYDELREGSNGIIDGVKFSEIKHLTKIIKKKNASGQIVEKVERVGLKLQKIDDTLTKLNKARVPKFDKRWTDQIAKFEVIAEGETSEQIYKRVHKIVKQYISGESRGSGDVLIITHGGVIKEYLAHVFKINVLSIGTNFLIKNGKEIKNCHMSIINIDTMTLDMMQDNRWLEE